MLMKRLTLLCFLLAASIAPHALPQEVFPPTVEMRIGETATFYALPINEYGDVVPIAAGQGNIAEENDDLQFATVTRSQTVLGLFTVTISPHAPPYSFINIYVAGGPATQETAGVTDLRIFVTPIDQPNENAVTGFEIGRLQ